MTAALDLAAAATAAAVAQGCTCSVVEVTTTEPLPGVELVTLGHRDGCPLLKAERRAS